MNTIIAPSILSADFSKMGEEIQRIEKCGADMIHCDVMDGLFVPNITFGPKMINDIRKLTSLPLDVHLMINEPIRYVENFAKAGADFITVHFEACENPVETLEKIKSLGVKCGIVISPDTDAQSIKDIVALCDMVLVMSVYPGFGGQKFIPNSLNKLELISKYIKESGKNILLEVDGGINEQTAILAKNAGANVLVAGSAVFNAEDPKKVIDNLRG